MSGLTELSELNKSQAYFQWMFIWENWMALQSVNALSGESPNSKIPRYEFWFIGIWMNVPLLPKKQMEKNKSSQNESIKQFDMFPWLMVISWSFQWSRTRPNLDVTKMSKTASPSNFCLLFANGLWDFMALPWRPSWRFHATIRS